MINLVIRNIYKVNGIYNLGSRHCINKKDFAIKFAKKTNIYHKNFRSIYSKELFATKRPTLMCMNSNKFEKKFKRQAGVSVSHFHKLVQAIRQYISSLKKEKLLAKKRIPHQNRALGNEHMLMDPKNGAGAPASPRRDPRDRQWCCCCCCCCCRCPREPS